ncbi:MAG: hypothetical protein P8Q37_01325 [Porticoccaceae bacterium]|nr:hypothetical protein [Porticoccaceae bacterium]MDG1473515.1 hypothetical protein [Porticoccaceae bacterium]
MKRIYGLLYIVYLSFLTWYDGTGAPVSKTDLDAYIDALEIDANRRGKSNEATVG